LTLQVLLLPNGKPVYDKEQSIEGIFDRPGFSSDHKTSISGGGSMGISVKNVVSNEKELKDQVQFLHDGYHGMEPHF
jgi:hypothetical protein